MNQTIPTTDAPATPAETPEAKRARLMTAATARSIAREQSKADAALQRLELVDRFERELGPEGQAFAIYDATGVGEGFFVVKLGEPVLFQRYLAIAEPSPAERFDFVSQCVVYPTLDEYKAARGRRMGIDIELANRLGALNGLKIKIDEGK